ncbi:MAG TPA: hypothetical protein VFQ35_12415 [Polyangiaceae bacterium]|nr:hypothetical protein [Polyangiaceae bacterium]
MKKSPVSAVKEQFQSKEKLVEAVQKLATSDLWLDRVNSTKGLARVSNQKLLRLQAQLTDAKSRFGSRAKLIDAILELEKRVKDAGYKTRLEGFPLPRLLDRHGALSKKQTAATKKPAPKKAAKAAAPAKPAAKAPAKKAPAAAAKKAPAKKAAKN